MKRVLTSIAAVLAVALPAASVVASPIARQTEDLDGTIAFERYQTPGANSETWGRYSYLVSVGADGSAETELTARGLDDERVPSWSPDGKKIAFTSWAGDGGHIYVMDRESGRLQQLTGGDDWWPTWSPDGKRIAFYRYGQSGRGSPYASGARLYTIRLDGSGLRALTDGSWPDYNAAWSPDGKWIAFSRVDPSGDQFSGIHIWAVRPDGSGLRRLTAGRLQTWRPAWSPDGRWLAFGGWYREDFEGEVVQSKGAIYVMPAAGGKPRKITTGEYYDMEPCWSPDSRRIAFTRTLTDLWLDQAVPQPAGSYTYWSAPADIYSVKLDGSGLVQVTNTPVSEEACTWAR